MKKISVNIDKLNDELFFALHNQPELVDDFLREEGYEPTKLEQSGVSKIKAILFKQQVAIKKKQFNDLYAKAIAIFSASEAATKEAILSLLKQRAPRLQYNNLEKMNQDDLRQILNESDLLDIIHKIERRDL